MQTSVLLRFSMALAFAALILGGRAEAAEKRIALVIGNGTYQTGALPAAANDAGLVAQTLQAAGFDVTGARDLDSVALRTTLREFVEKAASAGPDTVALFYFAGYGLQFDGENYLVPTDARLARDSDVPLEAIRVSDLVKPLAAAPLKARLIILDAGRMNAFAKAGEPLAGGLALMQPDAGTLIAFNAAPGTVGPQEPGPYGAYATSLVEMIKEGGLPLGELFERVRLRVGELTKGGELPWSASRIDAPFLFFERTGPVPDARQDRFAELGTRPIRELGAQEAYLAALARDTLQGYEEFLAAYPNDPMAKRVRAIVAARREAIIWRDTVRANTPPAYWSYTRRYPRGPHAFDSRRALAHLAAALEPPPSFPLVTYEVPPPPPEEVVYVGRPYLDFADPVYELPPPPPVPVIFLAPRPIYFLELPPPPPPVVAFLLPCPIYNPVPLWVARPAFVVAPVNVISVNIHNTVIINQVNNAVTVTNPAGQQVPALPATARAQQPNMPNLGQHPAVVAAATGVGVALPTTLAARPRAGQPASLSGQPTAPEHPRNALPVPSAPPAATVNPRTPPVAAVAPNGLQPRNGAPTASNPPPPTSGHPLASAEMPRRTEAPDVSRPRAPRAHLDRRPPPALIARVAPPPRHVAPPRVAFHAPRPAPVRHVAPPRPHIAAPRPQIVHRPPPRMQVAHHAPPPHPQRPPRPHGRHG